MHILHTVLFTSPNKENVFNDQNLLLFVGDHFLNILETLMFDSGGGIVRRNLMSVTLRGQIVEVFKYCWQGNLNWPLGSCQLCHPLIKLVQKAESRKQETGF